MVNMILFVILRGVECVDGERIGRFAGNVNLPLGYDASRKNAAGRFALPTLSVL